MIARRCFLLMLGVALVAACSSEPEPAKRAAPGSQGNSGPSEFTRRANRAVAASLPFDDRADFEAADRGLVARQERVLIKSESGKVIWDTAAYAFETGAAPDSVNPSLWRQALLNNRHGLYEVAPGIYQIRGYDLSNMSIIQGHSGWIVVDPLTSRETASAALTLAREHLGDAPIVAVILTLTEAGSLLLESLARSNDQQLAGAIIFMLTASIVGLNFFTDVMLALVDPRIRRGVMGKG